MIGIKEFVNLDTNHMIDILRIVQVCADRNISITPSEAQELWKIHSDNNCAGWLILPENDNELFEIIIEQAKKVY